MNASLIPAPAELKSSTGKRQLKSTLVRGRMGGHVCAVVGDDGCEQASIRGTRPATQRFISAFEGAVRLDLAGGLGGAPPALALSCSPSRDRRVLGNY